MTAEQVRALLAERLTQWHRGDPQWRCWVIEADGGCAGIVGWRQLPMTQATAEIGFMLLPEQEGKGLALQAVRALIQQSLVPLGFVRLVALIGVDNDGSRRLLTRLGFRSVARFEHSVQLAQGWCDTEMFDLDVIARQAF
ncbi:hypothetical protein GCM10023333_27590 [Ferrimonas pelagia]|uniref:N-acetyltransferase domain-containing protein n=2 Tax=Ferrimonas pelagia TaxID=1177826 RepID=A0ABP9F468_9GAMM